MMSWFSDRKRPSVDEITEQVFAWAASVSKLTAQREDDSVTITAGDWRQSIKRSFRHPPRVDEPLPPKPLVRLLDRGLAYWRSGDLWDLWFYSRYGQFNISLRRTWWERLFRIESERLQWVAAIESAIALLK